MKTLKLIVAALVFACVQVVFAQYNYCKGTVYFKAPDDWTEAYIGGFLVNDLQKMTLNGFGFYEYNLANLGLTDRPYFSIGNQANPSGVKIVTATTFNGEPTNFLDSGWPTNDASLPCPGEGRVIYVTENPLVPGKTYVGENPPNAKFLYVLQPNQEEWLYGKMIMHYEIDGVGKDTAMTIAHDMCGWFKMVFAEPPSKIYFYSERYPGARFGMGGLESEVLEPIDLNLLYEFVGSNQLYFIPEKNMWPDEENQGWYGNDPGVDGVCSFVLAGLIYDTDMSLNPAFTDCCTTEKTRNAPGPDSCVGVQHGLVLEDLGPDNKPVFAGTPKANKCFVSEKYFNALFNYEPNVNEVKCYDIPFRHYGNDSRWGFNSDSMVTNGLIGGFHPIENYMDADVITKDGVPMGPLVAARAKREAAGPVPNNSKEVFGVELDYVCSNAGFAGEMDCQGYFASGSEFNKGTVDLWCWGSYCDPSFKRWGYDSNDNNSEYEKRNQHFCMETHAKFTYHEDDEFTIIGDDDIWVFINRKLVVDNGGAHLPAPGHVVLKNLNTAYGAAFLVPGQDYPLDIFFCDRRTTMSDLTIKTNMNLMQFAGSGVGISLETEEVATGIRLNICVSQSGGGDCASVALGSGSQGVTQCGNEITLPINYSIVDSHGDAVPNCADCSALIPNQVNYGGIDLTNPRVPVVYQDKMVALAPGSYKLAIEIAGKTAYHRFRVGGETEDDSNSSTQTSSSSGKSSDGSETKSSSSKMAKSSSSYADDDFASPSFSIRMTAPFEFVIVLDEPAANSKKTFAVMDLQGGVLQEGVIESAETTVPVLSKGSYVVKVGLGYRRVNIR